MTIQYLDIEHVVGIHDVLIQEFGGSFGLRDPGLLESAVLQPQQSFGGEDLYPTVFDKAATYAFSISETQPFLDGNKRTAASTAAVFLDLNGYEVNCPEGEIYETMMRLANKRLTRQELANWLKKHSVKKLQRAKRRKSSSLAGVRRKKPKPR